jgi:hypothetical protein
MRDRNRTDHSRVLSDVSLVPETMGYSIVWLSKLSVVCVVILMVAIYDIRFLPIAIGIDVLVVIVALIGEFLTPAHMDSFGDLIISYCIERGGQDRLTTNPSSNTETNDTE